jgi:two-component system heavy metal sensor histidine kinase CusS
LKSETPEIFLVKHSPRPWSMTVRLIGLQILAVAVLIGGALFFLLRTITNHLDADDRDVVAQQASLLRKWFEDPNTKPSAVMDQIRAPTTDQFFFVRILDQSGKVLFETGNSAAPPASAFPESGQPATYWHVDAGPHFLMTKIGATVNPDSRRIQLQLAFDVTDDFTLIRQIRQSITVVFVLALLISAILAYFITRAALRPIQSLTEAAARVQASKLASRFEGTHWPVELAPLVREFDAMLARLAGSFRRLGRFSTDLSHELRTPINNLRGEAEVALNRPRTPDEYRVVLESSLEEYGRITRLIDTLLFIAKADQPQTGLKRQPLDAAGECAAVADFFDAAGADRGVVISVRGQAGIYCDSMLFRRALSNLVDNALRHTPRGGNIDLTVRSGETGATEVEVCDSGTGISPDDLPHVFERFYQASNEERESPGPNSGFGLGLAIVKSIMDLHAGEVSVASTPGRGTTISLLFPRQPAASTS